MKRGPLSLSSAWTNCRGCCDPWPEALSERVLEEAAKGRGGSAARENAYPGSGEDGRPPDSLTSVTAQRIGGYVRVDVDVKEGLYGSWLSTARETCRRARSSARARRLPRTPWPPPYMQDSRDHPDALRGNRVAEVQGLKVPIELSTEKLAQGVQSAVGELDKLSKSASAIVSSFERSLNPTESLARKLQVLESAGRARRTSWRSTGKGSRPAGKGRGSRSAGGGHRQKYGDRHAGKHDGPVDPGAGEALTDFAANPVGSAKAAVAGFLESLGPVAVGVGAIATGSQRRQERRSCSSCRCRGQAEEVPEPVGPRPGSRSSSCRH